MSAAHRPNIQRRVAGDNVWLGHGACDALESVAHLNVHELDYEMLATEEFVGRAQLEELRRAAREKDGDLCIILLGGRGAQSFHRILGELAAGTEDDALLARLNVLTQDALAPLRPDNGLSFVRDFERLLGAAFFAKVKRFTPMVTDSDDMEGELARYVEGLETLGGIDIFFLGLGPEASDVSHLAYIKPNSGANACDMAGVIPISQSILEHHVNKFKAGGSRVTEADEAECRAATHILTLGPAAILGARRIVQSVVDAGTAPAKRACYRRVLETEISGDPAARAAQLDANPGLWLRVHPNVRSLILPDVLED